MLLMSIAPIVPWKKGNLANLYKFVFIPLLISLVSGIATFILLNELKTSLVVLLSILVVAVMLKEIIIDFKVQLQDRMEIKKII